MHAKHETEKSVAEDQIESATVPVGQDPQAAAESLPTDAAVEGAPVAATVTPNDELAALSAKVQALEAEKIDLNDKYLRKAADFENYRKRMIKEKEDTRLYANTELLVDLVALLDDFDRAIQSSEKVQDFKGLHDGVSMIQKAFLSKLEGRYGLKTFAAEGDAFDPTFHEALSAEQCPGLDQATVKDVFLKGYKLHERVIRPAKVMVKMPIAKTPVSEGSSETTNSTEDIADKKE
jgi:molecular chaperone GrpE